MDDIDKFEGTEKVTVDGSAREGDATVVKTTLITASREHVPIDYRLHEESGRWMIVDITIESVSLVNHFRKTFSSALANMTVDQLIDRLEKQLPPTK
jgi:phospholipid transport system substrate-binding protein